MRLERVLEHAGSCLDGEASCFVAFAALYVVKVPMHPSFADFFFQPAEIKKTHETIQRAMTMDSVLQALEASNAAYVARLERNGVKDALTEALPGLFRGSHRQLVEDMAARFANEMRAARTVQKQQCQEASAGSSGPRAYGQSFATVQMVTEYKYYGVIIMERLTATNLPACASLLGKSSHDRNPASRTTFLARVGKICDSLHQGGILHGDLVAQNFGISKRRTGGVELQLVAFDVSHALLASAQPHSFSLSSVSNLVSSRLFERARRLCSDADENSDRTMQLLMTAERSMAVAEAERAWDQVLGHAGTDTDEREFETSGQLDGALADAGFSTAAFKLQTAGAFAASQSSAGSASGSEHGMATLQREREMLRQLERPPANAGSSAAAVEVQPAATFTVQQSLGRAASGSGQGMATLQGQQEILRQLDGSPANADRSPGFFKPQPAARCLAPPSSTRSRRSQSRQAKTEVETRQEMLGRLENAPANAGLGAGFFKPQTSSGLRKPTCCPSSTKIAGTDVPVAEAQGSATSPSSKKRRLASGEAVDGAEKVINAGADDEATKVAAAKAKSLTSSQGVKVTYGDLVKKYEKRANIKPKNKGRADPIRFKQQDAKRKDLSASPEKEQQNQSAPSALSGVEATNRAVLSEWLKHEELASGLEKSLGEEIKNPHIQAVFLKDRYWK
mmetsp:Transcript_28339/g.71957  ORF Transcript_28339/g.71957 Transcript_28339/m.71957 type:complete len:680 (-) Transcript_28339:372-2411(-)|eukprot:CAMPEP_0178983072 /NCGR_PEP_ID=MMETSP0795-20121207/848_1 /TAXON_ID=88552 /ORGANISM="Amoebophrya sp., Strain Ameob2" /LENGTH=679 /DNA_ID=CAMNT_0020673787 /DNA_START=99 /DNA_END=2138 /DNA_ORIENTATION=-